MMKTQQPIDMATEVAHEEEPKNDVKYEEIETVEVSGSRKRWLALVYLLTFYIPDAAIRLCQRQKRKDVRLAWREKLAINILIWLGCAFVLFFMILLPLLICPKQYVFSESELQSYDGKDGRESYVAIRGVVFDLGAFIPRHYPDIVPDKLLEAYAGKDATNLFPVQVSALCEGKDGTIDPAVQLNFVNRNYTGKLTATTENDPNARYHDFRFATNDSRPDWFYLQMQELTTGYKKGNVGFSTELVSKLAKKDRAIAILNERVYDFTEYIPGGRNPQYPPGMDPPDEKPDSDFMDDSIVSLFAENAGDDVSDKFEQLSINMDLRNRMQLCLDNLFYVGNLDTRNSAQCQFSVYILLAISILLASIIGFKFLAALQFTKKNVPENLEKFIMCTVPAYTEDEDSLRRAIDSAARMKYDDKRKLLVVICDGMIIGKGNDRTTPRIVLDILGVPESVEPEALSFESLGEGLKQHNMGKVYSGLYEVSGHIVPFMVIVKVGKPSEVSRPGNRGKRDSQMVIMRFLNRVHYNLPMTPLELEMHHHLRNIIGVNPTFYEFLFQIDADTIVAPDSATRMVSSFLHDTRIIGVCGETALTNAKSSFITMIQVYEYYISHNLTKAFESLFGSVTCLPGCFSMYRIRSADTGKPLFVSKEIVEAYSENRVDTLHLKNLLHLGEDRYLTTLLLKHHSKYKTKYIFRAHAWTIAPDNTSIFMSQRRRWINSTVHNLVELIPVSQLCGFCCFGMRFIVFVDLLSTIIQPTLIIYIIYLIVLVSTSTNVVPFTSLLLIGAVYGLQAIIFIVRRKWEMIGWMIIYVLATPIFAFALPLYAFWHMDDFSWGNTRVVMGEKGQKVIISDEGKFDPASIPRRKWEDYQAELWDAQTHLLAGEDFDDGGRSVVSGYSSVGTKSMYRGSMHGIGMGMGPGDVNNQAYPSEYSFAVSSRPASQLDLLQHASRMSYAPSRLSHTPSRLSFTQSDVGAGAGVGTAHPYLGNTITSYNNSPYLSPGEELELADMRAVSSTTPTPHYTFANHPGSNGNSQNNSPNQSNTPTMTQLSVSHVPAPHPLHSPPLASGGQNQPLLQRRSQSPSPSSPPLPPSHDQGQIYANSQAHAQLNANAQAQNSIMYMPSDDAILAEIRDILRTADLMQVTKKSVKLELEKRFGVSMAGKRAYIGSATEAVLSGQL